MMWPLKLSLRTLYSWYSFPSYYINDIFEAIIEVFVLWKHGIFTLHYIDIPAYTAIQ